MAYAFNDDKSKYSIDWIIDYVINHTQAYAVYKAEDKSFTFFRDEIGKYTDGQKVYTPETLTYYTNFEKDNPSVRWYTDNVGRYVEKVEIIDLIKPKKLSNWFSSFVLIENLDLSLLDTSNVTRMDNMFDHCTNLQELYLKGFNTSKVTSMEDMFANCDNLVTVDFSSFDTSKLENCKRMFFNCYNLNTTFVIGRLINNHESMCVRTSSDSGLLTLKYRPPATSAHIDSIISYDATDGNVINGGQA